MSETPTTEAPAHDLRVCDGCGQNSPDPMTHIWDSWTKPNDGDSRVTQVIANPSFHFDCLPADLIEKYGLLAGDPQHAVTDAAIEAARAGTRGEELRTLIDSLPSDNNLQEA